MIFFLQVPLEEEQVYNLNSCMLSVFQLKQFERELDAGSVLKIK